MEEENKHYEFLKQKSIHSFLLCIEIFNKPTIDYRLEGCVFFLCNAWELMLKAKLLKDGQSIYYPKTSRTLSLADCAAKVMTNKKDPIRVNLNIIISLRNTATHDIIPEFELVYLPYLTYCVKAYSEKMYDYLGVNISEYIKSDFLALFANNHKIDEQQILSKYGNNMKTIFDSKISEVINIQKENPDMEIGYEVTVNLNRVNNKHKADFSFYLSNNSDDSNIKYMNRYLDPNVAYSMTHHQVANEIDCVIKREKISFVPLRNPVPTKKNPTPNIFTTACLDVLLKKYDIKTNSEYCQKISIGEKVVYKYSTKLISYIVTMIMGDSEIVVKSKEKN